MFLEMTGLLILPQTHAEGQYGFPFLFASCMGVLINSASVVYFSI